MSDTNSPELNASRFHIITLAALGIVFGDIGTSPLYALKECFSIEHGVAFTPCAVLGVISMLFWAITIVVSLKYILFVMRADNNGEGGALALMALSMRTTKNGSARAKILIMLGVFGACMFYGDVVITPAISVLSAVEGLEIAAPGLSRYVVPIALVILISLFLIEKHGTTVVGKLFGPVMLIWFLSIGLIGVLNILKKPEILAVVNPYYAFTFMQQNALQAFIVLGSIVLVLTGAEALYADMGHFGIRPIRFAWLFTVMPCLILNYLGQGASLLINPDTIQNPFYLMIPDPLLFPMLILATAAAVIASQAVISGAFSLTSQAILLGFVPRMLILHTSENERGQIYVPVINWILLALVVSVVVVFQKSDNLAAAYGVAVTTTMLITTILAAVVMRTVWKWNPLLVAFVISIFFIIDFTFFAANLLKIIEGGWFPLLLGGFAFLLLMTWYSGRMLLHKRNKYEGIPLEPFIKDLMIHPPHRVEGTAVFMTGDITTVPAALLHNLKHNHILHERVFFLKISTRDIPYIADNDRLNLQEISPNIYVLSAAFGFKEAPDVHIVMSLASNQFGMEFDIMATSFFLARDTIVPSSIPGMYPWREKLFAWMYQNAAKPSDFFRVPVNRVVELGTKIEI
jgi:KUP system potassium uptake protein